MQKQNTPVVTTIELICPHCQQFPKNHDEFMELLCLGFHIKCKQESDEMEIERINHLNIVPGFKGGMSL